MTFDEFVNKMIDRVKESNNKIGHSISVSTIRTSRDKYTGLMFRSMDDIDDAAPIANLDLLYKEFQQHGDIRKSGDDLLIALGRKPDFSRENIEVLYDYAKAKNRMFLRLTGSSYNGYDLDEIPHRMICDMVLTCHILVNDPEYPDQYAASAVVTNDMMAYFGINIDQLFRDAMDNSCVLFPPRLASLTGMLVELSGGQIDPEDLGIMVLTNEKGLNGAAVMAYDNALWDVANALSLDGFWILPSSIHEVLIVPTSLHARTKETYDSLAMMVQDINQTTVNEEERLGDHPYFYDKKENRLIDYSKESF